MSDTSDSSSDSESSSSYEEPDITSPVPVPTPTIDWPGVSIITPTYNRSNTIKLAVVNFLSFDYPKDKIEWIIIDDSDQPIKDILPDDDRIKYHYFDQGSQGLLYKAYCKNLSSHKKKGKSKKPINCPHFKAGHFLGHHLPIGMKRNLAVAYAKFNYIIHMDDDDYYLKDNITERIKMMLDNPKIQCIGCTQLNQFHTTKLASIKTKASDDTKAASRFYESTLCYKKGFWNVQRFDSGDAHGEGTAFFKNRSGLCEVIEPTKILVSLIHMGNQDSIKGFQDIQPNGWHFEPIPDDLFLLITSF